MANSQGGHDLHTHHRHPSVQHQALRVARSTSIDVNAGNAFGNSSGPSPRPLQAAFEKLAAQRSKSLSGPSLLTPKYEHKLVWRERKSEKASRIRTRNVVLGTFASILLLCSAYSVLSSNSSSSLNPLGLFSSSARSPFSKSTCNPYAVSGKFHVDYSEPSENFWEPTGEAGCIAPRYVQKLRNADYEDLSFMQDKTIILFGDSIERDHVSHFCSLMGRDVEVIKGNHRLAVTSGDGALHDSARLEERKKKDRSSRIALKGMQESTLPRICYIEELNFMVANLYHFGLDEQDFWKNLDQFHPPGSVEERIQAHVEPFIAKLRAEGRTTAPDLIEVSSGMFDLARWAKQDIAGHKSTEESLSDDRLKWYRARSNKLMDAVQSAYPDAVKTWRATMLPEDQAQELDYFNDRFGHSPSTITPHFHPERVHQIDSVARELVKPYNPDSARYQHHKASNNTITNKPLTKDFVYNSWASLVRGTPAHQRDRVHGADIATPAAVLWTDIILWHLKQRFSAGP